MSRDDEIVAALRPTFAREAALIAARIEEASTAGRRDDVLALAHRLVGTAGTVQEAGIVTEARELEEVARNVGVDDTVLRTRAQAVVDVVRAAVAAIDTGAVAASPDQPVEHAVRPVVVAIEDNPANTALLQRIFSGLDGVELVTAETGGEGVRLARERSAALVLLDMNLPDVSGEWVLDALRDATGNPVTRIVVVSADATPQHEERARRFGASDYVAKPFAVERLRAIVREARGYVDS